MLVLARRVNESLIIPAVRAVVQVVSVRPNAVRLGIDAPQDITVYRSELYEAICAEGGLADGASLAGAVQDEHSVRNHLNRLSLGLGILRRQLAGQLPAAAEALLERLNDECQALCRPLSGPVGATPVPHEMVLDPVI